MEREWRFFGKYNLDKGGLIFAWRHTQPVLWAAFLEAQERGCQLAMGRVVVSSAVAVWLVQLSWRGALVGWVEGERTYRSRENGDMGVMFGTGG